MNGNGGLSLSCCSGKGHATANPAYLPAVVPVGRRTIGLALEGGGALGLAHIGVIRWHEEHRIPVDRISATSMGSFVGGLYASGHTPAEMEQIATGKSLDGIFVLSQSDAQKDESFALVQPDEDKRLKGP